MELSAGKMARSAAGGPQPVSRALLPLPPRAAASCGALNASRDLRSRAGLRRRQQQQPGRRQQQQLPVRAAASASEEAVDVGKAFRKQQNGSDIRGVAMEGVPGQAVNL